MSTTTRRAPGLIWAAVIGAGLLCGGEGGCSGSGEARKDKLADDPIANVKNNELPTHSRLDALDDVYQQTQDGVIDAQAARAAYKDLIWKGGAPTPLRQKALALLVKDTRPEMIADTRNLLRLRLPTENSWPMVVDICKVSQTNAADPAWQDQTAALVRSYARKVPLPPDPERPERAALLALYPGRSLEQTVFEVFAKPAENGAPARPDDYAAKASTAAWDLLGRLDPDGSARTAIIAARPGNEPAIAPIARAARDLGVTPITGSELTWVKRLEDDKDARNAAWWSAASEAVRTLSPTQRQGLQLRHIEPVRWAAAHHPEWLRAERNELLSQMQNRLAGRVIHRKVEGVQSGEVAKETLRDWESSLVWGDLLAMLEIDEALGQSGVVQDLMKQIAADQADTSTEYGGVLWATDQYGQPKTQEPFLVRGYSPRPMQRVNDRTFIAPEEMFADSSRSLAHYHFHVQAVSNGDYAGPGKGDFEYADSNGRSCVVITSIKDGIFDVDYYQRGGAVIDLGEMRRPK